MLRAGGVMVLTRYLLLLFLLASQAQNAHSAPLHGQGAVLDRESALSAPELEPDSVLIPSWYLKRKDYDKFLEDFPEGFPEVPQDYLTALDEALSVMDPETVPETLPVGESDSVPDSHEETEEIEDTSAPDQPEEHSGSAAGQKAKTAGNWDTSKNYILGTVAASVLLLLVVVSGCIVMYRLLKRDTTSQGDEEAPGQVYTDSSWESKDHPRGTGEAESGEGPGRGERSQAESFRDSCHPFPELFAAELAQLHKNMGADSSPLPTCPFCALADGASTRDHWISLDSPQPTPSWCSCYQYQQEYFILEDDGYFSDSI